MIFELVFFGWLSGSLVAPAVLASGFWECGR